MEKSISDHVNLVISSSYPSKSDSNLDRTVLTSANTQFIQNHVGILQVSGVEALDEIAVSPRASVRAAIAPRRSPHGVEGFRLHISLEYSAGVRTGSFRTGALRAS